MSIQLKQNNRKLRTAAVLCCGLLLIAAESSARGCGPWFPESMITKGDAILRAPIANFATVISMLPPVPKPAFSFNSHLGKEAYGQQNLNAGTRDLRAALATRKISPPQAAAIVLQYLKLIQAINRFKMARANWQPPSNLPNFQNSLRAPTSLPAEFRLYLQGALDWYRGKLHAARMRWRSVLALPAVKRHWRSTWAAYMIGRSLLRQSPQRAMRWFHRVQQLNAHGYADSLGLGFASIGWKARAELETKHFGKAIILYRQLLAAGDPSAINSLLFSVDDLLSWKNPQLKQYLARLAGNREIRGVVTAYILALGGMNHPSHLNLALIWLHAVGGSPWKQPPHMRGAAQLAWMAYESGHFTLAANWLHKAAPTTPLFHWLTAQLYLRKGHLKAGANELHLALEASGSNPRWRVERKSDDRFGDQFDVAVAPTRQLYGELGVVRLCRGEYSKAMDELLRTGYFSDAAFIGERVISLQALQRYVDTNWPQEPKGRRYNPRGRKVSSSDLAYSIRYLLARRMVRAGRLTQAIPYFPLSLQPVIRFYIKKLQAGKNASLSPAARAEALWNAAALIRYQGLSLIGSELAPDWMQDGAELDEGTTREWMFQDRPAKPVGLFGHQLAHLKLHAIVPDKRYHYRYIACNLAWRAARLMPANSNITARMLCDAGTWVKLLDPKFANRFYLALITRCPNTKLGQQATKIHWFPPMQDSRAVAAAVFWPGGVERYIPAKPTSP